MSALPEGQAFSRELAATLTPGACGLSSQRFRSPHTVHPTPVVTSLGSSPLRSPHCADRHRPQL